MVLLLQFYNNHMYVGGVKYKRSYNVIRKGGIKNKKNVDCVFKPLCYMLLYQVIRHNDSSFIG